MCWTEEISWYSLIIGTIFNIITFYSFDDKNVKVVCILWQYVLLMQLFEGMIWRSKNVKECKFYSRLAMIANITQPIIVSILLIYIQGTQEKINPIIYILLFSYIFWLLKEVWMMDGIKCINPKFKELDNCNNLELYWWYDFKNPLSKNYEVGIIFYLIVLLIPILFLLKPLSFSLFQIFYILLTFILSVVYYPCGTGSIWCWFASFAPIFTYLFLKFNSY